MRDLGGHACNDHGERRGEGREGGGEEGRETSGARFAMTRALPSPERLGCNHKVLQCIKALVIHNVSFDKVFKCIKDQVSLDQVLQHCTDEDGLNLSQHLFEDIASSPAFFVRCCNRCCNTTVWQYKEC